MGNLAVYKYLSFMVLVVTVLVTAFIVMGTLRWQHQSVERHGPGAHRLCAAGAHHIRLHPVALLAHPSSLALGSYPRCHPALLHSLYRHLYQLGLFNSSDDSKSGINVATYNVAMFGREINGFKAGDILSVMKSHQVDILCIQEYMENSGDKKNSANYLNYFSNKATGRHDMVIYSRYPIVDSLAIDFGSTNNSAMWADIDVNGQVFRVFNVHLETTGINRTLRQAAKQEMQGLTVEEISLLKTIYGNYTHGMILRASQADLVAKAHQEEPLPRHSLRRLQRRALLLCL